MDVPHKVALKDRTFFLFSYYHSLFVVLIVDYTRITLVNEKPARLCMRFSIGASQKMSLH